MEFISRMVNMRYMSPERRLKFAEGGSLLVAVAIFLFFFAATGSVSAADPRLGFAYPDPADFSSLSHTEAFPDMHWKLGGIILDPECRGARINERVSPATARAGQE
jgi:hypothetical protein